jgi:hypothetical protein
MHLICFVDPCDVEKAQEILDGVQFGATKGAKAVGKYSDPVVRATVPKIYRISVDRLDDAGIKNFALLNVGADQLLEAAHAAA